MKPMSTRKAAGASRHVAVFKMSTAPAPPDGAASSPRQVRQQVLADHWQLAAIRRARALRVEQRFGFQRLFDDPGGQRAAGRGRSR